jgi:hypothetical protein
MTLEKATLTNTVTGESIPVLFNPEEYALNREISYAAATVPGLSSPVLQFVAGALQTLDMELLVDSYEEHTAASRHVNPVQGDVRVLTQQVIGLMDIQASTHAPPVLIFAWGSLTFRCVLARAAQRFVMFRPDGTPVRARLQLSFAAYTPLELEAKEVKRETADFTKHHVVVQGETLSVIAGHEYGDPRVWRVIALRNGITDPAALAPGMELALPRLPYRDPDTGRVRA